MSDTANNIEKNIIDMMRGKTPLERLKMASSMFDFGKKRFIYRYIGNYSTSIYFSIGKVNYR